MSLPLAILILLAGIALWIFTSGTWVTVGIVLTVLGAVLLIWLALASRSTRL
jgi:hypothetical protein